MPFVFSSALPTSRRSTTLSLEAMILFSSNKTIKWINTKSAKEVEHLMQIARKKAPEFKKLFKQRRENIL